MESNMCYLESGVSQGSILGPLLFLIFVNDIIDEMECIVNLFADDTSVQQKIIDITSFDAVNIGIFCVCLDLENNAYKLKQNT